MHFGTMNVTLKEFPPELHSRLKLLAEGNGRSLNRQIIYLLDAVTAPQKVDDVDLLHRIKTNRQKIGATVDHASLKAAIMDGRE